MINISFTTISGRFISTVIEYNKLTWVGFYSDSFLKFSQWSVEAEDIRVISYYFRVSSVENFDR